jgi:hypothetical protein
VDLIALIEWEGAFGILHWRERRVSVIRIGEDADTGVNVYSVLLDGSFEDPVTLLGDDALSQWLADCVQRRH